MKKISDSSRYGNDSFTKRDTEALIRLLTILGLDKNDFNLLEPFSVTLQPNQKQIKQLLTHHNHNNRRIDHRHVSGIARSIEETGYHDIDPWLVGIDANFINGQHRMQALSQVRKPANVTIKFNMPEKVRLITDNGRRKTPGDALEFIGIEYGKHLLAIYKGSLDGQCLEFREKADWESACCRHRRNQQFPADEILSIYYKYQSAFDFVTHLFHHQPFEWSAVSSIRGAFLRACLNNPVRLKPVLAEIIQYKLNPRDSDDIAKVRLIGMYESKIAKHKGKRNQKDQVAIYALTESLIAIFAKNQIKPATKLMPTPDELFPFPALDKRKRGDTHFVSGIEKRRQERELRLLEMTNYEDEFEDLVG